MNYKKASVYTIIAYISKFSFLLIFPIIRRILLKFNSISEDFSSVAFEELKIIGKSYSLTLLETKTLPERNFLMDMLEDDGTYWVEIQEEDLATLTAAWQDYERLVSGPYLQDTARSRQHALLGGQIGIGKRRQHGERRLSDQQC